MISCMQEEGYPLHVGSEVMTVRGGAISMLGDTPGSNFVGGFKEGVGFALRKCRQCMATSTDIGEKVRTFGHTSCSVRLNLYDTCVM